MTDRKELLEFDGISRNVLEARILALVRVLDAAHELVRVDNEAQAVQVSFLAQVIDAGAGSVGAHEPVEERYEAAWDKLRAVLEAV